MTSLDVEARAPAPVAGDDPPVVAGPVAGGHGSDPATGTLQHQGRRWWGPLVERPGLTLAALWLAVVALAALAPGLVAGGDPLAVEPADRLQGPSGAHLFGTDRLGRDLFAMTVHGTRTSLGAALLAMGVGLVAGSALGLVAGCARGWVDAVVMRIADVLLAIPSLLMALALIAVLGTGTRNVAVAVGLASVASCSRIMRAEVLRVRESTFVEAAAANGSRWSRVLWRHVLPNAMGPVWALAALELGFAILAVSSLSFLGYGAPPPEPEWGSLVSGGRDFLRQAWWLSILPGVVVAATVLAANRVSRAIDGERHGAW